MNESNILRIQLLGPPAIFYRGQAVSIQRKNIRALLFYLACQDSMVSRGDLILHFWPEKTDEVARRNLRDALGKLRSELPDSTVLRTQQDLVGLDENLVSVDVRDFRQLIQFASRPMVMLGGEPLPPAIYQQLVRAVQMWSANEFMAGIIHSDVYEFQQWQLLTGRSLEYMRQTALNQLAEHCIVSGDPSAAINWLRKSLEYDPLNSELHYRLLMSLKTQGKRSEALSYIRYVQDLYDQEGEEFSGELQELRNQLEAENPEVKPVNRSLWSAFINLQTPYIGRAAILQTLKQAYVRGGTVVVRGEAGAGKTRLAHELYQQLEKPPRLMAAVCRSMETELPMQPWVDLLRYSVTADEWRALDVLWAARLAVLLPELMSIRQDILPLEFDPDGEGRLTLVEAIQQILHIVARSQRVLVILDDVQWASEATLLALEYLQERGFFKESGMLLIASRIEETNPHFEEFLNRAPVTAVTRMDLPPLTPDEIDRLTTFALGQPPSVDLVRRLEQETGGNPFFLLETLRAMLEFSSNPAGVQGGEHLPLSSSVHALVHDRLRRLPPLHSQVLATAAVIGSDFNLETLRAAAQMDEGRFVDGIEALERLHLIAPLPAAAGAMRYAFIHDIIREIILYELNQARKRMLHLRVARALESQPEPGSRQAALLAAHYEAGGDLASAFQRWLEAGRYARALNSRSEAWQAFERAEHVLHSMEDTLPDEAVYNLYSEWGDFALDTQRRDTAEKCFRQLVQLGERRSNPLLVGAGLAGLGLVAHRNDETEAAMIHTEHALPYLEEAGALGELINLHNVRGELLVMQGEFHRSIQAYERAIEIPAGQGQLRALVTQTNALYELSALYSLQGHADRGEELAVRGLRSSMRLPQFAGSGQAYTSLGVAQFYAGNYHQALESEAIGLRKFESLQSWQRAGVNHAITARICLALGRLDECLQHVRATEEIAETQNLPELLMDSECLRGELLRLLGDLPGAIRHYRASLIYHGYPPRRLDTEFRLGFALIRTGDAQGWQILQRVEQQARKTDYGAVFIPVEVARLTQQFDEVTQPYELNRLREHIRQVRQDAGRFVLPTSMAILNILSARVYLRMEDLPAARSVLDQAVLSMQSIANPWFDVQQASVMIEMQRRLGLPTEQTFAQFHKALEQIGLHARDDEIQSLFNQFAKNSLAKTESA